MAQPSVAREPSMEEILASIRQIIESNEPGAGRAISASLPPVYGDDEDDSSSDIHLTVDETYAGVEFPEPTQRPDPRFVAANSAGTAPEPEAPARALSLADVAARVRAAAERNSAQLVNAPREIPVGFRPAEPQPAIHNMIPEAPRYVEQPRPAEMPRAVEQRPVEAVSERAYAPLAEQAPASDFAEQLRAQHYAEPELPQFVPPAAAQPIRFEPVQSFAPQLAPVSHHQPVSQPMPQVAEPAPVETSERFFAAVVEEEVQQALVSQNTGLQVARSFDELAAAIDGATERRSLDEIAEDMLRPMLREWLDDNLPTMVERLVREEIERVARGPRR